MNMKTNNKYKLAKQYFLLSFLTLMSSGLVSCEDETEVQTSEYELKIPSSAYSFIITSVDNDNESIVYVEPSFTENFEILGCSVKKVIYYIDNTLASTEISAPFLLEYKTKPLSKGQHSMKAIFTVGGERFKEATVEYQKEFAVGSSSNQPAVSFSIEYDRYLRVGDKIHVSLNMIDRYNKGYKIREVKYYFDNSLISTKTEAPYNLDFSPTLVIGQHYPLQADISYSLDDISISSYGFTSNITVLADDETRYLFDFDSSNNNYYSNGDVLSGTGFLYRGIGDKNIYELSLYWDDELVGTSQTFPYKFNYTIKNANKGLHKLKHQWKEYDKDGNYSSQSQTETITIIQ